jgi:hypothetical protein
LFIARAGLDSVVGEKALEGAQLPEQSADKVACIVRVDVI